MSRRASSATTFDSFNYLGTSDLQTNASQSTTATRTYDAFGSLVASTGTPVGPFGFVGAEGYQEDGDSGLKLLGHRYYDPSTARFLTRDHAKDGRNWYVYCNNNPLSRSDPSGKNALGFAGNVGVGILGSVAAGAIIGSTAPIWVVVVGVMAVAAAGIALDNEINNLNGDGDVDSYGNAAGPGILAGTSPPVRAIVKFIVVVVRRGGVPE